MLSSDAFTVINTALIQTGNQPTVVAFDGTDEWIAGWNAYQLWLPYCLEARDWSFQRQVGPLTRSGLATWPGMTDAYAFPANCLHLITVWRPDLGPENQVWGTQRTSQYPAEYKIIGQTIQSAAPNGLIAEWLAIPSGTDKYSATFNLALIAYVASSLYSSLNEDPQSAEATLKLAEELLGKAAERVAQQQNRRVAQLASMLGGDAYTVISSALIQTGNQPPTTAWDGTDEWIDGWNAYQVWLPYCLEAKDWSFQRSSGALVRISDATWPGFTDAYAFPANCLHLITAWKSDGTPPSQIWGTARGNQFPSEYKIIGQTIQANAPDGMNAEWLTAPSGSDSYSATFNLALIAFVASSLYSSRGKDAADAAASEKTLKVAEDLLEKAAQRVAQQQNRRVAYLASGLAADPFTIISTALIQSGRQPPVTSWDGSDEWIDGWNAYQIWLAYCLEGRDWNFQTAIASLTRTGDATYPRFSDAYAMPPDCIHLQTIWRTDVAAMQPAYLGWGMTRDGIVQPQVEYRIIGDVIETTAPEGLTAKYLTQPSGTDTYSATFNLALAGFVTASLLGTDPKALGAAAAIKKESEDLLQKAAARVDQQENRKPAFRSRMIERRRARYAPWGWH